MIGKKEFEEVAEDFLNGLRAGGGTIADSVENVLRACNFEPEICISVAEKYKKGNSVEELYEYLRGEVGDKKAYRLIGYRTIPKRDFDKIMSYSCYIIDAYAK